MTISNSALTRTGSTYKWRQLRAHYAAQLPTPCVRCGLPVNATEDWHLDHLIPRNQGGGDDLIGPAHAACNLRARRKPPKTTPISRGHRESIYDRAARLLREQSTGDFQRDIELGLESRDRPW